MRPLCSLYFSNLEMRWHSRSFASPLPQTLIARPLHWTQQKLNHRLFPVMSAAVTTSTLACTVTYLVNLSLTKQFIESTVSYLGIEVDDGLEMAKQTEI